MLSKKQIIYKKAYDSVNKAYYNKPNVFRCGQGESLEHIMAKFLLFLDARENGHDVICECRFVNGSRADLFILDLNEAWEVLKTEDMKKFKDFKERFYPCKVIPFDAMKVIEKSKKLKELMKCGKN